MNLFWSKVMGAVIGLITAGAALSVMGRRADGGRGGVLMAECEGALKALVIQYVKGAEFTWPIYREFLGYLPKGVVVYVMCPDREAYEELAGKVGEVMCEFKAGLVGHQMTPWSRDRWVALVGGGATTLLSPRQEEGAEVWAQRAGDQRLAGDLAVLLGGRVGVETSGLYFDGGDFMADRRCVFVAPAVIRRNVQRTVGDVEDLKAVLGRILRRRVVLLEDGPDHHVGMFMNVAGGNAVVVGDPSLAKGQGLAEMVGGIGRAQEQFDAVAGRAAAEGYRVVRIPVVPGVDGKTYLTYVNVIIDQREGKSIVYMPAYRGCDEMNSEAEGVWRGLGYEVRRVDCTTSYRHFGNLHCLVNVIER